MQIEVSEALYYIICFINKNMCGKKSISIYFHMAHLQHVIKFRPNPILTSVIQVLFQYVSELLSPRWLKLRKHVRVFMGLRIEYIGLRGIWHVDGSSLIFFFTKLLEIWNLKILMNTNTH